MTVSYIHSSFIHSAISMAPLQVLYYSEALPSPDYSTDTVSEFHAEAHRQLYTGKGLARGPYMADRGGVEPTTLRLKAIDSTKAPPCPIYIHIHHAFIWLCLFVCLPVCLCIGQSILQ